MFYNISTIEYLIQRILCGMKSLIRILILTFMVSPSIPEAGAHTIYVVSISWHSGILIPVTSIPDSLWPVFGNIVPPDE